MWLLNYLLSAFTSLPKSRNEVHFEGEWTETHSGEHLLIVEDDEGADKLIIFSTVNNVQNLAEADKVFMNDCPRLLYQIFTIHAYNSFAYCLLP